MTDREDGKTRHDKERHVDHTAMRLFWQHSFDPDNDQCWDRLPGDLKDGYRAIAKWLLDSGALTMGACAYYDNESVRMMTVDYDRQAAAIEKIKGGGDDR